MQDNRSGEVPAATIAALSDVFLFFGTFDAILSHQRADGIHHAMTS